MQNEIGDLLDRLDRQGLAEAAGHLRQAWSALQRSEWEGANAQTRTALESLFNGIAALRLKTKSRDGAARKELEGQGILRSREARLIQDFIDVAGGAGSHAGVSNSDEARGRLLAGLGLIYIGLALIPELVRVEDVITGQLKAPAGGRLPTDAEMETQCPTCGTAQFLSEAAVRRSGTDTVYHCKKGCQAITVVSNPETTEWPGRGYRVGDYVIRNAAALLLPMMTEHGPTKTVTFPASPAALMKLPAS